MEQLVNIVSVLLLVIGFGFVVFWHELGHFLAAKAVGIKVEQFAVGFGQALLCWRKGVGLTVGTSQAKYQNAVYAEWEKRQAAGGKLPAGDGRSASREGAAPSAGDVRRIGAELGLGETEYRLNWVPLGGYVKMLGQDDLDPTVKETDPRAYNNKSIGARMFVVSAGVIMNIILAAMLFVVLFMVGYKVPPAIVGDVRPGSPAQAAGIEVGDRIVRIDGREISDFTKVPYTTALLREGAAVSVVVKRDGREIETSLTPRKATDDARGFLMMGVGPAPAMRVPADLAIGLEQPDKQAVPDVLALRGGDVITSVAGMAVPPEEPGADARTPSSYALLDRALQASDGKPVTIGVRGADGATREVAVRPYLMRTFDGGAVTFAGIVPRPMVQWINNESAAKGRVLAGDAVLAVQFDDTKDMIRVGSVEELRSTLMVGGREGRKMTLVVDRGGTEVSVEGLTAEVRVPGGRGLGVVPVEDARTAHVASVTEKSAAARAGITAGSRVVSVGGAPVGNLLEVRRELVKAGTNPVEVAFERAGKTETGTLQLDDAELASLKAIRVTHVLPLGERIEPRRTSNPITAVAWGVRETQDLVIQSYVTIKRMAQGSVSASNLTGPVGIFHFGGKIATTKGPDWLLWFLAMISANLAVVNFLPIPIVDGGLFIFLVIEKIMGRPLSPRAQGIAQIVGLGLIVGVFLFVTYNDIARLLM